MCNMIDADDLQATFKRIATDAMTIFQRGSVVYVPEYRDISRTNDFFGGTDSTEVRVVDLSTSVAATSAVFWGSSTWRAARFSTAASFSRFSSEPAVSIS